MWSILIRKGSGLFHPKFLYMIQWRQIKFITHKAAIWQCCCFVVRPQLVKVTHILCWYFWDLADVEKATSSLPSFLLCRFPVRKVSQPIFSNQCQSLKTANYYRNMPLCEASVLRLDSVITSKINIYIFHICQCKTLKM